MSLVQVARGAHLLTHNLWSLWLAWLCCCVGYWLWHGLADCG
jgi:membrane-associated PAP2 superfamily phosphatase